ncbi:MAG: DUF4430 domain-containing protein [Candidatus Hodarchaeota archaeon]
MNNKKIGILFFILLLFATLLFGSNIYPVNANSTTAESYSQDIDLNGIYIYNVSDFGGISSWYNFTPYPADSFEGNFEINPLGQIRINFTGFYNKDSNDWGNIFMNPIPWLNIEVLENELGILKTNFTLANRSNSEIAYNLLLGFNQFQPGFLIPIDNMTYIKQVAQEQVTDFFSGILKTEESYHFIYISYEQSGGSQRTYLKYDKWTGLLVSAKTSVGNYRLKINSINFTMSENQAYNYIVDDFGGISSWYNFTPYPADSFEGKFKTNPYGLISVNFTGLFNKDPNDWGNIFKNPIPWLDIQVFENISDILISNFTLFNRSNSEVSYNLILGYNNFQPGFRITTMNNITGIKQLAFHEATGFVSGNVEIQESELTLKILFNQIGGAQKTYLIYEKQTGLLLWAKTSIGNYLLEIRIQNYQPWERILPTQPQDNLLLELFPYLLIISISGVLVLTSLMASRLSPKYKKINKFVLIAILGIASFSSLFIFISNLSVSIFNEPKQEVYNITLIVDYGNGTIITVEDINLINYKTTAFDALNNSCDVVYNDYGEMGYLVEAVNGTSGNWLFYVNDEYIVAAANFYYLSDGDIVRWILS